MSKTIKEERLRWVLPIIKKEIKLVDAVLVCPYGKRSIERWVAAYKRGGEDALESKLTEPKRYRTETPIWLKEHIVLVRKRTKKCALKIHWQLTKEGIPIASRRIGKILKKEGSRQEVSRKTHEIQIYQSTTQTRKAYRDRCKICTGTY